ncbi:Uncharacterised protein [Mycobacterium tuberculosis]|nr:Uncharacterised protein [Mycobacterium tuberculosis]
MSRTVDPVGATGDDRDVALCQPGGQIGRDMLAVGRRSPGSNDGGRTWCHFVQARGAQGPQHQRRVAARPCPGSGATESGERQHRPLVVVGSDQTPTAAHE